MIEKPRTEEDIKILLFILIRSLAPEAELESIDPKGSLRDQVDLDSMDFLNLMVSVHKTLGIDIPEADYSKLGTLASLTSYIGNKLHITAMAGEI